LLETAQCDKLARRAGEEKSGKVRREVGYQTWECKGEKGIY
jgi:hypothetical protein